MPKASPLIRSFNGGEFSPLLEGRTDIERYPSSLRRMENFIAAPQGPAMTRSGTAFMNTRCHEGSNAYSALIPFVPTDEVAVMMEIADDRIRFFDEDGLYTYAPVACLVSSLSAPGTLLQVYVPGASFVVGDQMALTGFPSNYNLNGVVANVLVVTGSHVYQLDVLTPDDPDVLSASATVAKVYAIPSSFTTPQRKTMKYVQSLNVMYLLTGGRVKKIKRYGELDWRMSTVDFKDGPYLPIDDTNATLKPSGTGNAIPNMTSNTAPAGVCSGSDNRPAIAGTYDNSVHFLNRELFYALPISQFWYAFDNDDETYWAGNQTQKGYIQYQAASAFVCTGYTIYLSRENNDSSYLSKDYAPSSFIFAGSNNGTTWTQLDEQDDYVAFDAHKTVFFELKNDTAYLYYRLTIKKLARTGLIEPRVRRLVMRSSAAATFDLVASSYASINDGQGFLATDVDRLIRIRGTEGTWRTCKITARLSPSSVTVRIIGEPLLNTEAIKEWRLGYWSDTTGWPTVGAFIDDRLWLCACDGYTDMFAASVVGDYETFSQTDVYGEVLDDSAIVGTLNARKLARIRWLSEDDKSILMGTGSQEYAIAAASQQSVLTAKTIKVRKTTSRGSNSTTPVSVDGQLLYVSRSGRTLREYAYAFENDGYKSPSMSQLASHLGDKSFTEIEYADEPHSLVWVRRDDGSIVALTYNREENVIGWHVHDFSGAYIDSIAVMPEKSKLQDALWMQVRRQVNGQTRNYIERLTRFFDFDMTSDDAHFVDSGLKYSGAATSIVYGLSHLEGQQLYALADGNPVGPFTVVNGSVDFNGATYSNVTIGLGYEAIVETSRLENGAADGTAIGKVKRINSVVLYVMRSRGGQFGTYNKEIAGPEWEDIQYPSELDVLEDNELYTGPCGPTPPGKDYNERGSIYLRKRKSDTLPLIVVAIAPQLNTQDR